MRRFGSCFLLVMVCTSCGKSDAPIVESLENDLGFRIENDVAVSDDHSGYVGRAGMKDFLECVGAKVRDVQSEPRFPEHILTYPNSMRDLFALGGSVSKEGDFGLSDDDVKLIGETKHLDYLATYTISSYDSSYNWKESELFASRYFERDSIDNTVYASVDWFKDMVLVHEEKSGALYLVNPHVQTIDGEWEAWLFSHRFPGAMRFSSLAGLMAHLYLEKENESEDDIRFDPALFGEGCVSHLIR